MSVLPVGPTCEVGGYQPASTAARLAPTAAPRESAKSSTLEKSPAVPRPPETTMAASVSSGRPVACFGLDSVTLAPLAASDGAKSSTSSAAAPAASSGVAELGLTATMG